MKMLKAIAVSDSAGEWRIWWGEEVAVAAIKTVQQNEDTKKKKRKMKSILISLDMY